MAAKKTTPKKSAAKKPVAKTATKKVATKAIEKKTAKKLEIKKTDTKKSATKTAAKNTSTKKSESKKTETKKSETKKVIAKKSDIFRCPISGIPVKHEKPNLSPKTLEKLKMMLLEERARHIAQADELAQEAVDLITDREAGDTQFDEESGEGDSVAVERERTLFLSAEAHNTVVQIDAALDRMEKGTYGLCSPSSRRINLARLEALPWTDVCVDCKARSERRR